MLFFKSRDRCECECRHEEKLQVVEVKGGSSTTICYVCKQPVIGKVIVKCGKCGKVLEVRENTVKPHVDSLHSTFCCECLSKIVSTFCEFLRNLSDVELSSGLTYVDSPIVLQNTSQHLPTNGVYVVESRAITLKAIRDLVRFYGGGLIFVPMVCISVTKGSVVTYLLELREGLEDWVDIFEFNALIKTLSSNVGDSYEVRILVPTMSDLLYVVKDRNVIFRFRIGSLEELTNLVLRSLRRREVNCYS